MVPPVITFWSISRKESLESEQEHALRNRFVRTLLCSKDNFNPGNNRKMLIRKKTSILDWAGFNYEQLFHPEKCTACRICQSSSIYKRVLPRVTGCLSFSDQLHYLWGGRCFANGTRQNSDCLYQSGSLHILFSYHYILSILGELLFFCNQSIQRLAIVGFQLQLV